MFGKIKHTSYPPSQNILIWDGECGFCKFWKTRWEAKTQGKVVFETYQNSGNKFKDFPLKEFKKASRLIEPDGKIYSGPDSAYRSMWHAGSKFWHKLYASNAFFESISNHGYNHIAKNRSFYYKVTKLLFGKDPLHLKPYWLLYLAGIILIITLL